MRINWGNVPYFVRVMKRNFGNFGKVEKTVETEDGKKIYSLQSLVNCQIKPPCECRQTMCNGCVAHMFDFYDHEVQIA